jgi:hypothetical protein
MNAEEREFVDRSADPKANEDRVVVTVEQSSSLQQVDKQKAESNRLNCLMTYVLAIVCCPCNCFYLFCYAVAVDRDNDGTCCVCCGWDFLECKENSDSCC